MLASIPSLFFIILGIVAIAVVGCAWYIKKLNTKLEGFMQGKDALSLEAVLDWLTRKYSELDDHIKVHKEALEHINRRVRRSIQTHSLSHYDAFEDAGGNQSFASALLNEHGDGYILSIITHRAATHVYAKKISNFIPQSALTDEESVVLADAKKSL